MSDLICASENIIQPFPFGGGFKKKKILPDGMRAPLSEERKLILTKMVLGLAHLFANSDIAWAIDGGLSISLLNGSFIGEHRDIDVCVEGSQLEELQRIIQHKNYGFFLTPEASSREKMVMKRVGWEEFSMTKAFLLWIIAIDEDGLIQKDRDLSFINIHVVRRDAQGVPLGEDDALLPKDWFEPRNIVFEQRLINVASPVKTAYYKFLSLRNYDVTDLQYMFRSGMIDSSDVKEIERALGYKQNLF